MRVVALGLSLLLLSSASATPPPTPVHPYAIPRDGAIDLHFGLPDGVTAVSGVDVSLDAGDTWTPVAQSNLTSPIRIDGMTNRTAYDVSIRLHDADGPGTPSDTFTVVPREGRAYAWGSDVGGWLGNGLPAVSSLIPVPVLRTGVLADQSVEAVSGIGDFYCALTANGFVACWGRGLQGELGHGALEEAFEPVAVDRSGVLSGKTVTRLSAGGGHACAILDDGTIACWGRNTFGQLGNGTTTSSPVPVLASAAPLSGLSFTDVSTGSAHTCARTQAGDMYCWGNNVYGQLGNDSTTNSVNPVLVHGGHAFESIDLGSFASCGVTSAGVAYCWGDNGYGQLGNGASGWGTKSTVPVAVDTTGVLSGKRIAAIQAGWEASCAITVDRKVYCWGNGVSGVLGDGTTTSSAVPVAVDMTGALAGQLIHQVSLNGGGGMHTCAVTTDAEAFCWGSGNEGRLGDGALDGSLVPKAVTTGGRPMLGVGTGFYATVAWGPAPIVPPSAPTSVTVDVSGTTLDVAFDAPASAGDAPIETFAYSLDGGTTWTTLPSGTLAGPIRIENLTAGSTLSVMLRAVNEAGPGASSNAVRVTISTVPSIPELVSVTPGVGSLTVIFRPPFDGGVPLTRYEWNSSDGDALPAGTWTAFEPKEGDDEGTLTFTVDGLEPKPRTLYVRAVNANGVGPASSPATGTPYARIPPPATFEVVPGNGRAWLLLQPVEGATGYDYRLDGGPWLGTAFDGTRPTRPLAIEGLRNGVAYEITLRSRSDEGAGEPSRHVETVQPRPWNAPRLGVADTLDVSGNDVFLPVATEERRAVTFTLPLTNEESTPIHEVWVDLRFDHPVRSVQVSDGTVTMHDDRFLIRGLDVAPGGTLSITITVQLDGGTP